MATKTTPIKVTTDTSIASLLDEAAKRPLLLARDGELFRLEREDDITDEPDPERGLKILDATGGGWADLDIDKIIADICEARRAGSRPPDRP
jgi:hypothetical protein